MENSGEVVINPEPSNDELLQQLDELVAQDTQRRIHTRVVDETIDKTPVEPGAKPLHELTDEGVVDVVADVNGAQPVHKLTDVGYLVIASGEKENNKHVIIQETPRGKKVIVLTPPTAPGTETDGQMEEYLELIQYDVKNNRFSGDFVLKPQMLNQGFVSTDLSGFLHREEMLLADSDKQQERTLRTALNDAISFSKKRLEQQTEQGTSDSTPPPTAPQKSGS